MWAPDGAKTGRVRDIQATVDVALCKGGAEQHGKGSARRREETMGTGQGRRRTWRGATASQQRRRAGRAERVRGRGARAGLGVEPAWGARGAARAARRGAREGMTGVVRRERARAVIGGAGNGESQRQRKEEAGGSPPAPQGHGGGEA